MNVALEVAGLSFDYCCLPYMHYIYTATLLTSLLLASKLACSYNGGMSWKQYRAQDMESEASDANHGMSLQRKEAHIHYVRYTISFVEMTSVLELIVTFILLRRSPWACTHAQH